MVAARTCTPTAINYHLNRPIKMSDIHSPRQLYATFTKRVQKLQAKLAGVGEDGGVDGFMIRVFHGGGVWQNMMLLNFHSTQHPTVI